MTLCLKLQAKMRMDGFEGNSLVRTIQVFELKKIKILNKTE